MSSITCLSLSSLFSILFRFNSMGEEWNDIVQSKEEIEAKLQRKYEETMRRERAMAYSFSHQIWRQSNLAKCEPFCAVHKLKCHARSFRSQLLLYKVFGPSTATQDV